MKKTVTYLVIILFGTMLLTSCAVAPLPVTGFLYSDVKAPQCRLQAPLEGKSYSKIGTATCTSILGLVANGDCSVRAAMENGRITKIHHADYKSNSILGLYATYTLTVYGE